MKTFDLPPPTVDHYLVFDVESIGLRGEGFAVAAGIYHGADLLGHLLPVDREVVMACPHTEAAGSDEDRAWVLANTPLDQIPSVFSNPKAVRSSFWAFMVAARAAFPGLLVCAESSYPVEVRFLEACVKDDPSRASQAPYPLHDISSVLLAARMDPLATYPRVLGETPKHHPLCDVRQSARLLSLALQSVAPGGVPWPAGPFHSTEGHPLLPADALRHQ